MSVKTGLTIAWQRWTLDRDSLSDTGYVELLREEREHRRPLARSPKVWVSIAVIVFTFWAVAEGFESFLASQASPFVLPSLGIGVLLFAGFATGAIIGGLVAGVLSWLGESSDQRRMADLLIAYHDRCENGDAGRGVEAVVDADRRE